LAREIGRGNRVAVLSRDKCTKDYLSNSTVSILSSLYLFNNSISQDSFTLHLLVSHFVDSGRQMADSLVAVVNISIMFRQQVNVMEDKACEPVELKGLHHSGVVKSTFIEHYIAGLHTHYYYYYYYFINEYRIYSPISRSHV